MLASSCHIRRTPWAKALCLVALRRRPADRGFGPAVPSALAASTTTVDLGQASTYAVLSGASVGNTVNAPGAPLTTLRGDLGVAANAQPTGFPPGVVTGTTRVGSDGRAGLHRPRRGVQRGRRSDRRHRASPAIWRALIAHARPVLRRCRRIEHRHGDPRRGGNPNAVFVFQVGGALTMAAGANVKLINGAQRFARVLAGQRRRRHRRQRQVRGNADGTRPQQRSARARRSTAACWRSPARSRLTPTISTAARPLSPSPGGQPRSQASTTPTISGTTDRRSHRESSPSRSRAKRSPRPRPMARGR